MHHYLIHYSDSTSSRRYTCPGVVHLDVDPIRLQILRCERREDRRLLLVPVFVECLLGAPLKDEAPAVGAHEHVFAEPVERVGVPVERRDVRIAE